MGLEPAVDLDSYLQTPHVLWVQGIVAPSEEVAKQRAMDLLVEECPPSEGWIDHRVSLNTEARATLKRICEGADGQMETGSRDNEEWPDIIFVE